MFLKKIVHKTVKENEMNLINMLLAETNAQSKNFNNWWYGFGGSNFGLQEIFLIIMSLCALFIILVVLFQPGNSSGVSALGGTTETFLGKNRSKTFEHKMRVITVISAIVMAVLCIVFAIVNSIVFAVA